MNPMDWSREYQVAGILTAALGAIVGLFVGVIFVETGLVRPSYWSGTRPEIEMSSTPPAAWEDEARRRGISEEAIMAVKSEQIGQVFEKPKFYEWLSDPATFWPWPTFGATLATLSYYIVRLLYLARGHGWEAGPSGRSQPSLALTRKGKLNLSETSMTENRYPISMYHLPHLCVAFGPLGTAVIANLVCLYLPARVLRWIIRLPR